MSAPEQKISAQTLFDEVDRFIADSRTLLQAGAIVQLSGLDERVAQLCEAVLTLTQDDRIQHAQRLQQLLWNLNDLGETMAQYRDAMAEEIKHLGQHQKANLAYRTIESIDAKKDEEK